MDHLLAAVDLGSNSFRLSIGRVVEENDARHIFQIDRLKETVRLAAGLNSAKMLSDESIERAINVLERFGDRLRSFHPDRVRAVATNTFRVARNVPDFLPRAEAALGFPIEVIAGREEARLIYAGVSHTLPVTTERRLVIDIGGGSTEVIIGKGDEPVLMSSLYMGCVSYSRKFFPDGVIDAYAMKTAELAARREFEVITKPYRKLGWAEAFGSSGTAKALYAILVDGRLSQNGITREGLDRLKQKLIRSGRVVPLRRFDAVRLHARRRSGQTRREGGACDGGGGAARPRPGARSRLRRRGAASTHSEGAKIQATASVDVAV